jgi:SnoaL-like domain
MAARGAAGTGETAKDTSMPFTGPIEDRLAIQDLYGTAADASSRGDKEAWMDTFAREGGEWNSHLFRNAGMEAIRAQWDELWAGFDKVGFLATVGSIEVDGDTALARCTAREVIRLIDGKVFKLIGLYRDQLVRQDGAWKFTVRDYEPLVFEDPV